MATNVLPTDVAWKGGETPLSRSGDGWTTIKRLLRPVASLKLTIVLFSLAIFIILAGTLAQVDKDIWVVMRQYFRTMIAWVELKIFFPRDWNISGGFYFPGGGLILSAMVVNLLAAHAVRFTVQAKGTRLVTGLVAIAAAIGLIWAVVASGSFSDGIQDSSVIGWPTLWMLFKIALAGLVAAGVFGLTTIARKTRLGWWILLAATMAMGGLVSWLVFWTDSAPDPSAMRILWQLIEGATAGSALLGACWIVFKKRAGIVVIHAGIGLMMFNELFVYMTAVESQLRLREGAAHNYTEDIRTIELAIVDRSDPKEENTVVIPKSLLENNSRITSDKLPFDVQAVDFLENSELTELAPGDKDVATAGAGLDTVALDVRPGAGTDAESNVDISSAYVKLLKKGTTDSLGTYLVSVEFDKPERIEIDGQKYEVALRFKRVYKPYMVRLDETRMDVYQGTNTPRNYSSDVHLIGLDRKTDFRHHIWMNNPLRFG
ncbi:MAG TPA: hypothetical protein VG056_11675, partial [Pirellulales bacterium]|nr:hypothetical protein [Pirellulales bacterium]